MWEGRACDDLTTSTPTVVRSFDDSGWAMVRLRQTKGRAVAYVDQVFE